jgi:hypothetical protein
LAAVPIGSIPFYGWNQGAILPTVIVHNGGFALQNCLFIYY